jgi:hypothetical protein
MKKASRAAAKTTEKRVTKKIATMTASTGCCWSC